MPATIPPPPSPHISINAAENQELDERAMGSSGLMGTESMVGHLDMRSPLSAQSPGSDSPAPTVASRVSLRRRREEEKDGDQSRRPTDPPNKRRRRSEREIDMPVPAIAPLPKVPTPGDSDIESRNTIPVSRALVASDFQPPKRILAKVIATPESCLPTISLSLVDPVTSWGRGYSATVRYTNGRETRIPKYAFKIFLFKPGFYPNDTSPTHVIKAWDDKDQDMTFYISSKASAGIWINDTNLPSNKPQNPSTPSKFWGELHHGDYITVWLNDQDNTKFTRFRFECFWGNSKHKRDKEEEFKVLEDGELLNEIERTCLAQEKEILVNQVRREEKGAKSL